MEVLAWVSRCSHSSVGEAKCLPGAMLGEGGHKVYGPSLPLEEAQLVARVVSYGIHPHQGATCK